MTSRLRPKKTQVMDPFCGKMVDPATAVTLHWEGKTYFFCSEECRRKFEQDPPGVAGF
jgi:Cu+-exporting ATPase